MLLVVNVLLSYVSIIKESFNMFMTKSILNDYVRSFVRKSFGFAGKV